MWLFVKVTLMRPLAFVEALFGVAIVHGLVTEQPGEVMEKRSWSALFESFAVTV
jgi:hypothetical protein